jgi:hypothetical protein
MFFDWKARIFGKVEWYRLSVVFSCYFLLFFGRKKNDEDDAVVGMVTTLSTAQ